MAPTSAVDLTVRQRAAVDALVNDLRAIFGSRLDALVVYGLGTVDLDEDYVRTLALVEGVTFDDLAHAVPFAAAWHRRGLAVPLLLSRHEFARTLDVFPLEYGNIIANHIAIVGANPFGDIRVAEADRRRGCEQQAKSHLIHLREGFLETEGDPRRVAELIASSAPAFRALLTNLALLEGGGVEPTPDPLRDTAALAAIIERAVDIPAPLITDILTARAAMSTIADPTALLARYIDASERIWRYVDGWRG